MRVAVVHDWLCTHAGAERVLQQILEMYPLADLYTVVDFLKPPDRAWLGGREVRSTFIQRLPWAERWFRHYLPLMPLAIEQVDLSPYDLILSSSHAVAKGVLTRADQPHVCYIHTPMRYAWDMHHEYLGRRSFRGGLRSALARGMMHYIRMWDQATAHRVDAFAANSRYVARRVRKAYRRRAEVIYPPVDVEAFSPGGAREDFYLTASRLVPYKRVDLIIEAFNRRPDLRLRVIGDGPDAARLRALAGPNVTLLGRQPEPALVDAMRRARAFLFAAEEDFGIAPVEAQACGTPVICLGKGGATESVVDGVTGLFFAEQSVAGLSEAIARFEANADAFEPEQIRRNAERFSGPRFRREFSALVDRTLRGFTGGPAGRAGSRPRRRGRPVDPAARREATTLGR
jgi:glycosyltransferase involved in cell wall biosynthesis